jgi:hypothetical protein
VATDVAAQSPVTPEGSAVADAPRRRRPAWRLDWRSDWRRILTVAAIVVLLGLSSSQESPVSDEATYIGAAAAFDKYSDLDMNIEHPPLAKLVAGLPFRFTGIDAPRPNAYLTYYQRQYGWHVIYVSNNADHVVWLARIPEIVLTIAFGLLVFFFARDLWGDYGGLAALALYSVTPSFLAQGGVATNDMLLAETSVATLWLLWRARLRPLRYLPLVAVTLGLALATKATAFALIPLVAGLAAYIGFQHLTGPSRRRWLVAAAAGAGVVVVAIGVLWCVYLAADPQLRVAEPHVLADQIHGLRRTFVDLLPVPHAYKVGLLIQMSLETHPYPVAIFGHSFADGTRLFLPAALLVKTPIPLLLLGIGGGVRAALRRNRAVLAFVVLPTLWLLVSTIALTKRPYGSRYVLSVMVMLCVLAGGMLVRAVASAADVRAERRRRLQRSVAVALVGATAVGSYLTYPFYFTYSNVAFGGSTHTYSTMPNDADTDQDLRRVADYIHDLHATGPIYWMEHGGMPSKYGIDALRPQAPDVVQGLYVVFGSQLDLTDRDRLRHVRPQAIIGNDVFIYDLPPAPGTVPAAVNARAGKRDLG